MKSRLPGQSNKLVSLSDPMSPTAEMFRNIRLNIGFASRGQDVKTILVTSTNPNEGKSLTASNLAVVMAQNNTKTLYVDGDLRKPTGHYLFRLPNQIGLSNYLSGESELLDVLQPNVIPHLSVVTAGPVHSNLLEMLGTERIAHFIQETRELFDVVIIDSPPLVVSDALLLASYVDGTVIVVDAKSTKREEAVKAVEQLRVACGNILGVVMNNVNEKEKQYYY